MLHHTVPTYDLSTKEICIFIWLDFKRAQVPSYFIQINSCKVDNQSWKGSIKLVATVAFYNTKIDIRLPEEIIKKLNVGVWTD